MKVEFVSVGKNRREWMWKARDASNIITISGQRFDSLPEAVRDAGSHIEGDGDPDAIGEGPFVA